MSMMIFFLKIHAHNLSHRLLLHGMFVCGEWEGSREEKTERGGNEDNHREI